MSLVLSALIRLPCLNATDDLTDADDLLAFRLAEEGELGDSTNPAMLLKLSAVVNDRALTELRTAKETISKFGEINGKSLDGPRYLIEGALLWNQ